MNRELADKIKQDFPALKVEIDGTIVTYLDSAATSLKPLAMVEATNEYYLGVSSNVHRGKSYSGETVSNRYEEARFKVAHLLGCAANEVAFLRNTTEAINVVASGLELKSDDIIIVFSDAHHSHMLPWMDKGDVRFVNVTPEGAMDLAHYQQLLELKPKVVAITHCSNTTGIYHPLAQLVADAKAAGAITVVDAAQSIPHRKLNVAELDIDFLAFSAHKMLGPTGVGVLFGKQDLLRELTLINMGGGMVDWVDKKGYQLRKIPHRFEAGTPNIAGAYGLAAAIDYLNHIGFENIAAHDIALGKLLLEEAQKRDFIEVIYPDPDADRGAVLSFKIKGIDDLDDISRILSDSYGIMIRNGHLCAQPYIDEVAQGQVLRVSAYLYNDEADITTFFDAIDEIADFML